MRERKPARPTNQKRRMEMQPERLSQTDRLTASQPVSQPAILSLYLEEFSEMWGCYHHWAVCVCVCVCVCVSVCVCAVVPCSQNMLSYLLWTAVSSGVARPLPPSPLSLSPFWDSVRALPALSSSTTRDALVCLVGDLVQRNVSGVLFDSRRLTVLWMVVLSR